MTESKERSVYYYKIEAKLKNQDVDIYSLFNNLTKSEIDDEEYHYKVQSSGHTVITKVDDNSNLLIRGFIANIRQNNLPGVMNLKTKHLAGLNLEEDTALVDPAHFVIYKDYMAIEFNANAPRVSIIPPYMQYYFPKEVDFLTFLPIMKDDPSAVVRELLSLSSVTYVRISETDSFAEDIGQKDLIELPKKFDRFTNSKTFKFSKKISKETGALNFKKSFTINLLDEFDDIILNGNATNEKLEKRSLRDYKERDKAIFPLISQRSGMVKSVEAYKILVEFLRQRGYS